ncbi:10-formyltetrahydrofolate:L-methionyl-tRNA(fMet) N-formyltransferase [Candidatus Desulfarcum epimagneticum]|uniref:Methionyl-tRNA formyltransferase n=1 Tax=uncultured Desulfobacteraceae bacterium TaxID=218296 RepID=A0A484HDG7_9BACT|nr:10-formyltetrahydrofolate:L-methionyl-tRNA(fMet) N-formyltransferase [uncultured Desulfobacteraceae bacterium]
MTNESKEKKSRVVFMGSPDFAVPSLRALVKSGHDVVLAVTRPDRKKGRGRKRSGSPVKEAALEMGLSLIQPESAKDPAFVDALQNADPDFLAVVAYGELLPEDALKIPALGAVNVHPSLLPRYRGPAPIQWALINGEKETGVSTMLMSREMDAGDILFSVKTPIGPDDDSATLHDRLARIGADLLVQTLDAMKKKTAVPRPQDHSRATRAPLLKKKDGRVDWEKPARDLESFIQGVTPWPGAFSFCRGKRFKFFKAAALERRLPGPPGAIFISPGAISTDSPDSLCVKTGQGALSILELQPESGKRLLAKDFLKGWKPSPGWAFE